VCAGTRAALKGPSMRISASGIGINMELDLQSLFGLHVYSCTHWLRPSIPPPPIPTHLGSYTRALLVSQGRRRLFVTPLAPGILYNQSLFQWATYGREEKMSLTLALASSISAKKLQFLHYFVLPHIKSFLAH
jgi:hypothetical protein